MRNLKDRIEKAFTDYSQGHITSCDLAIIFDKASELIKTNSRLERLTTEVKAMKEDLNIIF